MILPTPEARQFHLPLPPTWSVQEGGRNWRARHFPKKRWMANAHLLLRQQLVRIPAYRQMIWMAEATLRTSMDPDNVDRLVTKWPFDLFKQCGLIPDDAAPYVRKYAPVVVTTLKRVPRRKTDTDASFRRRQVERDRRLGILYTIWGDLR